MARAKVGCVNLRRNTCVCCDYGLVYTAKSWEGHGHGTLLTDSGSSAERVFGSEGVTVLVYRVVGIQRLLPCCRTVSFVTVAVLDPVTGCAQECKSRDFVPKKNRREEERITPP